MELDDEVCLCFRVTKRKLIQHLRVNQPQVASQMSECGGAGTGCGWCVPFLKKLFSQSPDLLGRAEYAAAREKYRETGERPEPTSEVSFGNSEVTGDAVTSEVPKLTSEV